MRKPCKECPWAIKSDHNERWKGYVEKINRKHACHMITSDVWGYKHEINEKTECTGSKERSLHPSSMA